MTSTITGLPDRYRPLDEVGPEEPTPTGVIHCWRAKDRVLNRDVAIRVHTPGGSAARSWISRALTAGGLATPALAMVYDAAEGSDDPEAPGGAAYVVNEWIEGRTLAERLAEGPMPEREARTVLRRLAEGVAEAHRVGLAVGGLTPDTVVLRPNGLVGLRSVPAARGTVQGDIAALGELLEYCLTGRRAGEADAAGEAAPAGPTVLPPDLAALIRRARSTEPGAGLSSVAAMAALLAERPRPGAHASELVRGTDESDSGWLRRLRERRPEPGAVADEPSPTIAVPGGPPGAPRRLDPHALPPVPPPRADGGHEEPLLPMAADEGYGEDEDALDAGEPHAAGRRRLVVVGLPLLALVVVVALAWWLGTHVLSVAGSVDEAQAPVPSPPASSAPAEEPTPGESPAATIEAGEVYDPFGDGEPENDDDVPLSFDGDPATAWSTVTYRGSPAFGNLKPGVGVLYDLGTEQALAGVTLTTTTPGATMEVRVGDGADGDLDSYRVVASGEIEDATELDFEEPVTTRYVLVWITSLVDGDGGFTADVAEVELRPAD
ncbi:MAG TPA: protein kinase family protein [Geodermatophilus sp.]|nr:protein kinase family protein [Geodermatophilus sp.]